MPTDRTQAQSAIPEAVVDEVAARVFATETEGVSVRRVLAALLPLTGPGPNGEWGRWELAYYVADYEVRLIQDGGGPGSEPVYRFVPEATDD